MLDEFGNPKSSQNESLDAPNPPQDTPGTPPGRTRSQKGFPNSIFDGLGFILGGFWEDLDTKMVPKTYKICFLACHTFSSSSKTSASQLRPLDIGKRSAKQSDATRFKQFFTQRMKIFVNGPQSGPMQRVSNNFSLSA